MPTMPTMPDATEQLLGRHIANDGNSTDHMWIVKSSCRHKETWRWNEEVGEAVKVMKKECKLEKRKINKGIEGVQEE